MVLALITGGGAGYLPFAPGTWGSLEGILLVWAVHKFFPASGFILQCSLLAGLMICGLVFSARVSAQKNHSDFSKIVIDEITGQVFCLLWVPISVSTLIAGFVCFRFFDIAKPFPIRQSEKISGSYGIMADDLIAGFYAGLTLKVVMYWVPF